MKYILICFFALIVSLPVFAQDKDILDRIKPREHSYTRQGNEAYQEGRYSESETYYMKALDKNDDYFKAAFNLGDALYRQERYDNAAKQFERATVMAESKAEKGSAYYNLGNARMAEQQYDKAVAAYQQALINDPQNADARYNMLYAMKMLKEQQQNQQNQDNQDQQDQDQNQDQQDQENQDQQNQDQQNQDQQNQDQQNQDQQNKDQQDQENQQSEQKQSEKQGQPGDKDAQPMEEGKMSKEQVEQMLQMLRQEEDKIQEKLQRIKARGKKKKLDKDW